MPARQFDLIAALSLLLLCTATVWAEPVADGYVAPTDTAIATDAPTAPTPDPRVVAREILRLQEELGGSVVSRMEPNPTWNSSPRPSLRDGARADSPHPWRPMFSSPVVALRETAWQLEQSAYWLESLDLYSQADALRETANKLRRDARELKANGASQ
jgi:hypothetical protein